MKAWEQSRWKGSFWIIENYIKDRKTFFAMAVTFLGYLVLLYMLIFWAEEAGYFPHWLEAVVLPGTLLFYLIAIDMFFLITNLLLRFSFMTHVYGPIAGLLSLPRIFVVNIINGLAAYRAFSQYINSKRTGQILRWEKTQHEEGAAQLASDIGKAVETSTSTQDLSFDELLALLSHADVAQVKRGLQSIHAPFPGADQARVLKACLANVEHPVFEVRAVVAKALVALNYDDVSVYSVLLTDHSWVVRAGTARAIVESIQRINFLNACFEKMQDKYGRAILTRTVGNRMSLLRELTPELQLECLSLPPSAAQLLRHEAAEFLGENEESGMLSGSS